MVRLGGSCGILPDWPVVRIGRRLGHSSSLASGKARKAAVIFYQVCL